MACWRGKAVGGPYEGWPQSLDLTYYDPVVTEMEPNDDLDLQVVYGFLIDQINAPRVDRHELIKSWEHIGMSPDEYGVYKRNIEMGLQPSYTGIFDNGFPVGMT